MPHPRWSTQDFNLRGPPNATAPHTEDRTPYSDSHTVYKGWQDTGAISVGRRTISMTTALPVTMPHSVLSTVSYHYTPRFGRKRRLLRPPLMCAAPPCDYKRRRRASFRRDATLQRLQTRSIITYAPAYLFSTFNPSSSRDLGAYLPLPPCLYPLLQAHWVQDNTVPSHTPFAGRTVPRPEPG